jgi:hypothetical protein
MRSCQHGKVSVQTVASVEQPLRDGKLTIFQILERVPLDQLADAGDVLKAHRSPQDACRALRLLVPTAPLADFRTLSTIYRERCASPNRPS